MNGHTMQSTNFDAACKRFEHTITVKVTTQHPNASVADTVKLMLGPWCESSELIQLVDTHETVPAPSAS